MDLLRRLFRRSKPPIDAVLYTGPACGLCAEMKAEIARAPSARRLRLREVSIAGDRELVRRFGRRIPVLELEGRVAFEGRLAAADLERELARLARAEPRAARASTSPSAECASSARSAQRRQPD